MNNVLLYDKNRAAAALEILAQERMASGHTHVHIANLTEVGWPQAYQLKQEGPIWRLAYQPVNEPPNDAAGTDAEEAVLTFQGVIYNHNLPPFKEKPSDKYNQARHVRQGITVGGLGTGSFGKVIENIAEIHALFSRVVQRDETEECGMMGEEEGEKVLYASNRYFTSRKDAPNAPRVVLKPEVDPNGYLARMAGDNFVHTEENYVYYFEKRKGRDGVESFEQCSPVIFRVGDIVEVQVSFVMLTLRDGRKKTSMILRSILLLDGSITRKSMTDKLTKGSTASSSNVLKRRVGYGDQNSSNPKRKATETISEGEASKSKESTVEVSNTQERFSRMDIDRQDERYGADDLD